MMPPRRFPCWSLWQFTCFLIYFLQGIRIAQCAADDVLLVFCQCPFGYYQASRFPVLLQFTPPCGEFEPTRSATLCGRWKTYGLKCVRCHPNCDGCHGPADSHCDTCTKGFFNASFIHSEPVLPRQREPKRTSSTENLHFFHEDEWSGGDGVELSVPKRQQRGRRTLRDVKEASIGTRTYDGYEVSSFDLPRPTAVPEEQAIDEKPISDDTGEVPTTSRIIQASGFIEDEELIPLTTQINEQLETIQHFTISRENGKKGDNIDTKLLYSSQPLEDTDVNSDSGSGDVLMEEELRAQLAPPSSPSPTQQAGQRHPPTPSNYWYPETRRPAPVKRNGATAENIFEHVRIRSNPSHTAGSLPTPAALLKPTHTYTDLPEALVSEQPTKTEFVILTTTSSTSRPRTKAAPRTRGTGRAKQESTTHSNTVRTSRINMRSATSESSTTLDHRPVSSERTSRRKNTTTSALYNTESSVNNQNNSTDHQSSTKRRSRKTTIQPVITEQTYTLSDTEKPVILVSRSTIKDVSHSSNIFTTVNNETRYKSNVTTDNVNYKTNLWTTLADPVSSMEVTHTFRCLSVCPEGTYKDFSESICRDCDSKCRTCVGPSFMNCTTCAANAVQAAYSPPNSIGHVLTVTCLSECPGNHFVYNGTCTPCHESCDECYGFGPSQCFKCRHHLKEHKEAAVQMHPSTPPPFCLGEEEERASQLELILPLAFVCFLVLVTIIICIRWNCKPSDLCFFSSDLCNKWKKQEDKENLSSLPKKLATSGKIRNEYTPSPPNGTCPKCQSSTTDDGYELPLHPTAGTASLYTPSSLRSSTSSANHTMIKPRRNDPLPLTPVEVDAMKRRESNASSNVYKNIPQTCKTAESAERPSDIEAIPSTSSQSEEEGRKMDSNPGTHLILTDTAYSNSEGLYANC